MVKVRNAFMTKVATLLLCMSLLLTMIPFNVVTVFATNTDNVGTVTTLTEGGSVNDANDNNIVVNFGSSTITWVEADPSIGRVSDGWWVGIKVAAPGDMLAEADFDNVTYKRCTSAAKDTWGDAVSFWATQDSDPNVESAERYITMWCLINEQYLNDAIYNDKDISYTWKFDWNADENYEQKIAVKINPDTITLKKDGNTVYPATSNGVVSAISDGLTIDGDSKANVVKAYYANNVELDWIAADNSIGRVADGWWAGIKVTAPAELKDELDFVNVNIQSKSNGSWGTAMSFWQYKDSADTDEEHFVGLWGLINKEKLENADGNLDYAWRFDWNGDGIYEQLVTVEIDPSKVTLKDEFGVQIHPDLGTVTTITGGAVTGSGTGNVVVDASNLTLEWSPKDTSIGRYVDGWWAGILITAPADIELSESKDVNYQSKVGSDAWSSNKSFYKNQDSAKDGATHYMQLWTVLDRAKVADAIAAGESIKCQWRFDWNKDGDFEQLVTLNVDPTTVTLNRVDRTDFSFADVATDKKVWVGDGFYTNIASCPSAPGTVTYALDESATTAPATIDAATGKVTFTGVGKVVVKATIAEDDVYNAKTIKFSFEVVKAQVEGLQFAVGSPADRVFGQDGNEFTNLANDALVNGNVTYSIIKHESINGDKLDANSNPVATIDANTGKVTILRSGIITVQAVRAETGEYLEDKETYTLTINKADQTGFAFVETTPTELTYSENPYDTVQVSGGQVNNATITYEIISGSDVAKIVDGNKIKTLKNGKFTLAVTNSGDDCYNPVTVTREMNVSVAEQTTFAFKYSSPNPVTYNENGNIFTNEAIDGESSGEVTYTVISGNEVAKFKDASKPRLTIKQSGTVVVQATKAGDDKYASKTIEYTLVVNRADQEFTFADSSKVVKYYGIESYINAIVPTAKPEKADGLGYGNGAYTYELEKNDLNASIDPVTGEITFGDSNAKVGILTVNVTKAEDEKYNSCSNKYTLEIKYPTIPTQAYQIEEEANDNGWYDRDITIVAPNGYKISYNSEISTGDWAESVIYTVEGETEPVVYLKSKDGDISDAITVSGCKIDKSAPISLNIEYDNVSLWEQLFGFADKTVEVTLTAEDKVSGIDFIEYTTDGWVTETKVDSFNGSFKFDIPAQYRGSVEFKATDMAGNISKFSDGKTVVVDEIAPSVSVEYDYHSGSNQTTNNIIYANKNVTVTFNLKADNFDLSNKPVVKVNGEEKNVSWNSTEVNHIASVELTETDDYIVTFEFRDRLGRAASYNQEIHIDKENPSVADFKFISGEVKDTVGNRKYYDEKQTVQIVITEHNFDASLVNLEVTADNPEVDVTKYLEDYKKAENWVSSGDTHTANIVFDKDANYTIKLSCGDLAGNTVETETIEFTVDKTAPTDLSIEYSGNVFEEILSSIFFNNAEATVSFSATDATAGVKYFAISVEKEGLAEATDIELPEKLVINADGTVKSGSKGFIGKIKSVVDGNKVTLSFDVPAQFRGLFKIDGVTDLSHNTSAEFVDDSILVADKNSPKVSISFAGSLKDKVDVDGDTITRQTKDVADEDTRFVYDGDITATITVKEANFYGDDMTVTVYRDGEVVTDSVISDWAQIGNTYEYVKTITMSKDGDYQIYIEKYEDKSDNKMDYDATGEYADKKAEKAEVYASNIHTIDTTLPTYEITYDNNTVINTIDGRDYFNADRTATIKVTDRNFRPNEVDFTVIAKDVVNDDVTEYTYSKLTSWDAWKQDGITWTATVPFNVDANYTVDFTYTDIAGRKIENDYNTEFTVDKTPSKDLNIEYKENFLKEIFSSIFFYNSDATVEISATDATAGIEYFAISVKKDGLSEATDVELPVDLVINADGTVKSGTKGFVNEIKSVVDGGKVTLSFDVPAEFRGEFVIDGVTDWSHNTSEGYNDDNVVVVDTVSPKVNISFAGSLKDKVDVDSDSITRQTKEVTDKDTRFVYDGDITATITVKEANFYGDDMTVTVYRDGEVVTDSVISDWAQIGNTYEYVKTITMSKDGDYQIYIEKYEDKSDNKMDYDATGEYADKKAEKAEVYASNIHTIDTTLPTYEITYDNNTVINTIDGRDYFNADRTATIKVTDRNFRPNEVDFTVIAKDVVNDDVTEYTYSKLTSWDAWKQDGITWTATVPFNVDANYTVDFTYTDIAGHKIENDYNAEFSVDKIAPNDLTIEYLEPTFVEKVIEFVTFNFYNAPVKVQISATDDIAGVYHFMYSYARSEGVSEVNAELINEAITNADIVYDGNKATATFTIPKETLNETNQFRGNVEFTAYDRSENNANTKDDTVVVVDSIAPNVDITYTPNSDKTSVHYTNSKYNDVESFDKATQAYYNGNVTAKITINEANFFEGMKSGEDIIHEIGILLTKTDNDGVVTKYEFLPQGSAQMFANETANTKDIVWTTDGDIHTFEINYKDNADYQLTVKYVDFSTNEADIKSNDGKVDVEIYNSKIITVDKINPVIKVEYSNTDVKNTIDGRDYFNYKQMATITVTEHNFRANDIVAEVVAKNVIDEDIEVADYAKYLSNRSNWKHYDSEGNEVENFVDGNIHVATITYTKDANYMFDIAYTDLANRDAEDYAADYFTVDKTAPTNLTVSYSTPKLWQTILEDITFGFYNAKMTVTITADDITSSIYHFRYSYTKNEDVSDVNAELIDAAIKNANITYNGKTATATFDIPKLVLKDDNQFNGTVNFTAFDRAENSTDKADEAQIIVDNIKPTSKVTFNEPVQKVNNISYYAGEINSTIVINEANFYSEDVKVSVTKDGKNYPVKVDWVDETFDIHTGTFTLTEDGDYFINIKYADRSTNEMDSFESNRLTIDTKAPTVNVSNVKNNSANKDETYGFTLTANDINIDAKSIKPVFTAVIRNDDGSYATKAVSLGDMRTVEAGKTYSFTVNNLKEDAIYSLVCTLKDMSGNEYSKIVLGDGKEYDEVRFSVNREGSTFAVNESTEKLINQYYVQSVDNNVVIEEINVDPVEKYSVKLNGKVLTENKDYTTSITNNKGEWSKRTYVINKALFENEGEYNIIVESTDKTETTAFSDIKSLKVAFVVDKTAPILTISGLETKGKYQTEEQTVTVMPADDGGKLNSIKIILMDEDGKEVDILVEMAGEELLKYLEGNDGKITFKIPQVYYYQVRIICNDYAVDNSGKTNTYDETFERVTVSPSWWVLFYADKPLFYGSIAGVVGVTALIIMMIVKKRKKEEHKK